MRGVNVVALLLVLLHDQLTDGFVVFCVERDPGLEVVQAQPDFGVVSVA